MKLNYLTLYYLLLTLIGLPLLTLSVHAAHHGNLDPAGTWKIEITASKGQTYYPEATASIRKEAGELAGLYTTGYTGQTIEIESITLEDNQLSFTANVNHLTLNFSGAIEGEMIKGTMSVSSPQGSMDGIFTGSRNSD